MSVHILWSGSQAAERSLCGLTRHGIRFMPCKPTTDSRRYTDMHWVRYDGAVEMPGL
jgi:hypothetical protein